jgi:hypothetical protein
MNNHLEKSIIESLYKQAKTLTELTIDLGMSESLTFKILQRLLVKEFITYQHRVYSINSNKFWDIKNFLSDSNFIENESRYFIYSALQNQKDNIYSKKLYLTDQDRKFLNALLYQLESFLTKTEVRNKKEKYALKDTEVFYWARQNFGQYIQHSVKAFGA